MFINFVLPALATWAPVALIVFAIVVAVFAVISLFWPRASQRRETVERFDRWLRTRQARSPLRVWAEIIALAVGTALLVTLIDWLLRR